MRSSTPPASSKCEAAGSVTVGCAIPVYRPDGKLFELLRRLALQTRVPDKVILMVTDPDDAAAPEDRSAAAGRVKDGASVSAGEGSCAAGETRSSMGAAPREGEDLADRCAREFTEKFSQISAVHFPKSEFDHGGTRNRAAELLGTDYYLFMTQDAMPADRELVASLLAAFRSEGTGDGESDGDGSGSGEKNAGKFLAEEFREDRSETSDLQGEHPVAAAYARQLPSEDSSILEVFARRFNYPPESVKKTMRDIPQMGVRTYFCSDVCAMWRADVFQAVGPFDSPIIFNEDMVLAGKLVKQGYAVVYDAGARVRHSHNYSAMQQFHRNFDLGVSQTDHPEVFAAVSSQSEGVRYVKEAMRYLLKKGRPLMIGALIWQSGWKYLGYRLGRDYQKLPRRMVLSCTSDKGYWERAGK